MSHYNPSTTYKYLYDYIIADLMSQICNSNKNFCIRSEEIPYIMGEKFDAYRDRASEHMHGSRLDRHKLASCICGAIIESKPFIGYKAEKISKNANEIFALFVGLNVIKLYMMYDLLYKLDKSSVKTEQILTELKENFEMHFPSLDENICDTQEYQKNLYNALYWSHSKCDILNKECFKYDIWAYSKIFYHLELYNKYYLQNAYSKIKAKEQDI